MKMLLPITFIILFPYSIALLIYSLFFRTELMEYFFHNSISTAFFYICVFWLISFISTIFICIKNVTLKQKSFELAKINMIIKLTQIPAYLFIFIFGFFCMFTIFTFGLSFILMGLDCTSIFLSGLFGISVVKHSHQYGILSTKELIVHGILQFVFCADVISSIILFKKTKNSLNI